MVAATYTVSLLIGPPEKATPLDANGPAIADSNAPAS
jgi:hypothetical protein